MQQQAPDLMTSPQAAAHLGVSTRTVHRLAESGALPVALRLPGPNGALLYRRADVLALALARESEAAS